MSDHYDRYNGMEELLGTDCISRQQAIDAVNSRKTAEQSSAGIMRNAVVDFCVDIIKKLPSAQPKHGKWIDRGEHGSGGRYWHEWECNTCHHYFDERTFFCPHCGTDMRGEQDGGSDQQSTGHQ